MPGEPRLHNDRVPVELRHYGAWLRDRTTVTLGSPSLPGPPAERDRAGDEAATAPAAGGDPLEAGPDRVMRRLILAAVLVAALFAAVGVGATLGPSRAADPGTPRSGVTNPP